MALVRPARLVGQVCLAAALFAAAAPAARAQDAAGRAAVVNGTPILAADVDAKLGNNLAKLQEQIYALRQKQLESMIDEQMLTQEASRRGVAIADLVKAEITSRVAPVTDEDAAGFYEENKAKLQGDLASLQSQIKNYLNVQRIQARQQEFLASLRKDADVSVFLEPPPVFRAEVATAGAPVRGNPDAPVTIVEFSDFHCPYCRRVQPALTEVLAKYGPKVRLVYRDMPIDSLHPKARVVAEAARCADEQGKFWAFHDKVFTSDPDATKEVLDRFAREVGLDVAKFDACRTSGTHTAGVQASTQEGTRLGINGTPTFFINGRILVGAQPVEAFSRVIDEELAASAPAAAAGGR